MNDYKEWKCTHCGVFKVHTLPRPEFKILEIYLKCCNCGWVLKVDIAAEYITNGKTG